MWSFTTGQQLLIYAQSAIGTDILSRGSSACRFHDAKRNKALVFRTAVFLFLNLYLPDRYPETSSGGFSPDQIFSPMGQVSAISCILGMLPGRQAGTVLNRMFAEPGREAVYGMVEAGHFFHAHRIIEERILAGALGNETGKNHGGLTVGGARPIQTGKPFMQCFEQLCGIGSGPVELYFAAVVAEVLLTEEKREPLCGQIMATGLDAGIFEIPGELGKNEFAVG